MVDLKKFSKLFELFGSDIHSFYVHEEARNSDLAGVFGKVLRTLKGLSSDKRVLFAKTVGEIMSELVMEAHPVVAIETPLVAELMMAAIHERPWRLRWNREGYLEGKDLVFDDNHDKVIEQGDLRGLPELRVAYEAILWQHMDIEHTPSMCRRPKYEQKKHQRELYGWLRAKADLNEQCYCIVGDYWDGDALQIPYLRIFDRVEQSQLQLGTLDEHVIAGFVRYIITEVPELL